MPAQITLSNLRNGIQEIYREVIRERQDGEISNEAILNRVRAEKIKELELLTPALLNIALTKILNDVSGRRSEGGIRSNQSDLFEGYRVPRMVTIIRGRKKDTAKLNIREAEIYLKAHSEKSASDRYEPFRRLIDDCRKFMESEEDTLEVLIERKREAESLAL